MRLLLVEPDVHRSQVLSAGVGAAGGVVHREAAPPHHRRVLEERFDAVLLDWQTNPLTAADWLRALRLGGYGAPVLALLGGAQIELMPVAIEAGANDCLLPPHAGSEALARLRLAASRQRGTASRRVQLGEVTVDLDDRRVHRQHQPVALTAAEWLLLEALATRPGRTVTRAQLEARLDGRPSLLLSNRLEVHIASLRRKLGRELILTMRGLGYRTAG